MAERKSEISISSPEFYQYSCNLGIIVHFYEEMLGKGTFDLKLLGILASLELLGNKIPEETFEFYGYCLEYAATNHVVIDVDGSKTPIPPFDPEDPMCADCHELVDIAMVQYAFIASVQGGTNPLKDYLGGVFSYSGIAFEGVDDGYHIKNKQIEFYFKGLLENMVPTEEKKAAYVEELTQKLNTLKGIFERNEA